MYHLETYENPSYCFMLIVVNVYLKVTALHSAIKWKDLLCLGSFAIFFLCLHSTFDFCLLEKVKRLYAFVSETFLFT